MPETLRRVLRTDSVGASVALALLRGLRLAAVEPEEDDVVEDGEQESERPPEEPGAERVPGRPRSSTR